MNATLTKKLNKVYPATRGVCRWVSDKRRVAEYFALGMSATCAIETVGKAERFYEVVQLSDKGKVTGYSLRRIDTGKTHHVDISFGPLAAHWTCDCPDSCWRDRIDGACIHKKALFALLNHAGVNHAS
jgi:hypothetical protein